MPTGYTSDIYNGEKKVTLKEFTLNCARAFGALVSMRDDSFDTPIPDELIPDTSYHDKNIEKIERKLKEYETTPPDLDKLYDEYVTQQTKLGLESKQRNDELLERYNFMLTQVKEWVPPTPEHKKLHEFMINQLEESIKFDCYNSGDYYKPVTKEEWVKTHNPIDGLKSSLKYHKEQIEVAKRNNLWLKQLRDSL